MMHLFPKDHDDETVSRNWLYYMPRTEHGSSLSAGMYALTACRIGLPNDAYALFIKNARIDMSGESKQYAGGIYIGGTHPAAAGGAWMTAVFGFAGFGLTDGEPQIKPTLPNGWERLSFRIVYKGLCRQISISREGVNIKDIGTKGNGGQDNG